MAGWLGAVHAATKAARKFGLKQHEGNESGLPCVACCVPKCKAMCAQHPPMLQVLLIDMGGQGQTGTPVG